MLKEKIIEHESKIIRFYKILQKTHPFSGNRRLEGPAMVAWSIKNFVGKTPISHKQGLIKVINSIIIISYQNNN